MYDPGYLVNLGFKTLYDWSHIALLQDGDMFNNIDPPAELKFPKQQALEIVLFRSYFQACNEC